MKKKLSTFFIQVLTLVVVVLCISFSSYMTRTDTISPIQQLYSDTVLQNLPDIDIDYISAIQNPRHLLPINSWFFKNIGEIPHFLESVSSSVINSQFNIQTMFHFLHECVRIKMCIIREVDPTKHLYSSLRIYILNTLVWGL